MSPKRSLKNVGIRQMKFKIGNKGVTFAQLSAVGLAFVLVGVTLGMGVYINSQIQSTAGWGTTTKQYLAVANATEGLSKLAQWLPIIAIVLAAGVVISTLVTAFSPGKAGV